MAALGGYVGGGAIILALPIVFLELIYSLIPSLYCLYHKAFKPAAWYFIMGFTGVICAIGPLFLAKYVFMSR